MAGNLREVLEDPNHDDRTPSDTFRRIIATLMDKADATPSDNADRDGAIKALNLPLNREGLEAIYGMDGQCHIRPVGSRGVAAPAINPHKAFTELEVQRKARLIAYLDRASEDELIGEVLLPLLRHLGFHRITASGHKDKALEYGKDIWMRYTLPTQHVLYFGMQVKKGKLDASGVTKSGNANVAEILNQAQMMLAHAIFDPEINKRVLVDHAFIAAGGEITKAARNLVGENLDAQRRSQIIFMDREDILNLYTVTNLPIPS